MESAQTLRGALIAVLMYFSANSLDEDPWQRLAPRSRCFWRIFQASVAVPQELGHLVGFLIEVPPSVARQES